MHMRRFFLSFFVLFHVLLPIAGPSLLFSSFLDDSRTTCQARSHYNRAVELAPKCVGAHINLALLCKNVDKDYAGAETHLRAALEVAPDDFKAHANLASLLQFQLNRSEEAIEEYRRAIAIDGSNATLHVNLATLLAEGSQVEEGEAHLRAALSLQPGFLEAHLALAAILAQRGEGEEAVKHCNTALSDNKDSDTAHHTYACILANHLKRYEAAAAQEREALRANPNNADAHYHLALLLFERFLNDDEALDHAKRVLALTSTTLVVPTLSATQASSLKTLQGRATTLVERIEARIASERSEILLKEAEAETAAEPTESGVL
eukprot:m.425128 g.425128  ORF g.425128 m.425128 type:complete len:321 (+) comp56682_c0_seq3:405-1367(+)